MIGTALLSVVVLISVVPASAAPTFLLGNHPQQPGEENILFSSVQNDTPIFGVTNQSQIPVVFDSPQFLSTTAVGQANLTAASGALQQVSIFVVNGTYGDLIINPFVGQIGDGGNATVTVDADDGSFPFSYSLGKGNNFLTIVAGSDESIFNTTITASGGFSDLRQPRISGIALQSGGEGGAGNASAVVPEPGSVLLLGVGLLILSYWRRKLCAAPH
jgi:hypothetical protein